jgi:hypothetical protein
MQRVLMLGWSKKGRTTHIVCVMDPASQWYLAGTLFHCLESATMAPASKTPKPNRWLNSSPTPFMVQWKRLLASYSELRFEVSTVRCWMSRHVNIGLKLQTFTFTPLENKNSLEFSKYSLRACVSARRRNVFTVRNLRVEGKILSAYFASRARAKTPAASGAAAEVPEWVVVHFPYRSVVAWNKYFRSIHQQQSLCVCALHRKCDFA